MINEITDRDHTRYLPGELAELLEEVACESLVPYLRALQRENHHWDVESYFTRWARQGPLTSAYDKALGQILVHEEALQALQGRAQGGDLAARDILARILAFCGREAVSMEGSDRGSDRLEDDHGQRRLPDPAEYSPPRLSEFIKAVHDARDFGDDHIAAWTTYWHRVDPDGLLAALTEYRNTHGRPHERQTPKLVVELARERRGPAAAWEWLVAYHDALYGWQLYMYSLSEIRWIWDMIYNHFPTRWLEFIAQTARPHWRRIDGAPSPDFSPREGIPAVLPEFERV
ncbi:hypothetical protein [Nannocystis punicea]|uniref:Uncharacterized protein n=1 Tax=Nannocystis punicea TaxID=2995304 RepID=A0ABY7GYG0_9BACT|nr:hypothetical protein [Nannocystis poenicansa]WAS91937.1 hypothetical protein O0S08_37625 [Nannocystis poenicansa]